MDWQYAVIPWQFSRFTLFISSATPLPKYAIQDDDSVLYSPADGTVMSIEDFS
jgi:hypothetical protein